MERYSMNLKVKEDEISKLNKEIKALKMAHGSQDAKIRILDELVSCLEM